MVRRCAAHSASNNGSSRRVVHLGPPGAAGSARSSPPALISRSPASQPSAPGAGRPTGAVRILAGLTIRYIRCHRSKQATHRWPPGSGRNSAASSFWWGETSCGSGGQEATISSGSRKCEWRRSRLRGRDGADIWIGFGIRTYNLDRMVTVRATRYFRAKGPTHLFSLPSGRYQICCLSRVCYSKLVSITEARPVDASQAGVKCSHASYSERRQAGDKNRALSVKRT
jgi:hypothetical protein